jgi:hypothetical protein
MDGSRFYLSAPSNINIFSLAPIGQSICSIEEGLRRGNTQDDGAFIFQYPPRFKEALVNSLDIPADVHILLDFAHLYGILHSVQNIVLDWSLELEKSGVRGEGLTFTDNEKRDAQPISQHIFAQNIGILGNLSHSSQAKVSQSAILHSFDYDKLENLVTQVREMAAGLPMEQRDEVKKHATMLEEELAGGRNTSRIKEALVSLRAVCERAAGNVVAQGIIRLVDSIF